MSPVKIAASQRRAAGRLHGKLKAGLEIPIPTPTAWISGQKDVSFNAWTLFIARRIYLTILDECTWTWDTCCQLSNVVKDLPWKSLPSRFDLPKAGWAVSSLVVVDVMLIDEMSDNLILTWGHSSCTGILDITAVSILYLAFAVPSSSDRVIVCTRHCCDTIYTP